MNRMQQGNHVPELLCPAGSPLALDAAIEGGADAVYLGGLGFNARMNATNFTEDDLREGIARAHAFGVQVYLTMNTLLLDRERDDYLRAAEYACRMGADALIVADLGGAAAIHRSYPSLALHASTQMSAHNAAAGALLAELGFSRMVVAREFSLSDLQSTVAHSPIEIEAFIHGALCVCHSGQCLFSSLVGGRSGNRGECAQPCRLPYRTAKGKEDYPLSLKDLSLARHVPALINSGVASLKIEGRMKSPEYVLAVTRIWRRLLDERRAADDDEMRRLEEAFSRGGFTDGYFTEHIGKRMLGVRSESDKQQARELPPFRALTRHIPLTMTATLRQNEPISLTVSTKEHTATVCGDVPQRAMTAPLTEQALQKQFSKLGGTPYALQSLQLTLDPDLMVPVSALNELRRRAISALETASAPIVVPQQPQPPLRPQGSRTAVQNERTARFCTLSQLTPAAAAYFDVCYLPLHVLSAQPDAIAAIRAMGTEPAAMLPEVIMERETDDVRAMLATLVQAGLRRVMLGNLGHLSLVREHALVIDGDFRLNVTNRETVAVLEQMGFSTLLLSPELTLPQIRDIPGALRTVVYGRIPLMLLEKCVIKELADCSTCVKNAAVLTDRRGQQFPVRRTYRHRNVIYNSHPTYMADRAELLDRHHVGGAHFIFSDESPAAVDAIIRAYKNGTPPDGIVRRIGK